MFDFSFFPVPKLHFYFLLAHTTTLSTSITGRWRLLDADTGPLSADGTRCRGNVFALTGIVSAFLTNFFFPWLPIPLRIREMLVGIYKIVNRKKFFSVKQAGAASYNLLKLNHRIYRL